MLQLIFRAVINPRVAWDLVTMAWAYRARNWFRKPPFLPTPPDEYRRWRMYTAYGDENAVPPLDDVLRFARWRRKLMRL